MSIDALELTDGERRFLAMHARYEANRQGDPRYCAGDPDVRVELRERWHAIAAAIFDGDPWKTPLSDQERADRARADHGPRQGLWGPDGEPR